MGSVSPQEGSVGGGGSRVKLALWHPNCWTLEVTAACPGGFLGHGVHEVYGEATGRFTAYADTEADLKTLVEGVRDSPLTHDVREIEQHDAAGASTLPATQATVGLLVRYDHQDSINDALITRGFIPDAPVRITDGKELWTVVIHAARDTITDRLDEIRCDHEATISVELLASLDSGMAGGMLRRDTLSERQREVFELARRLNYYSWPREISAGELATELGVSESTTLEHLRKAEAKLLGNPDH